MVFCGTLEVAVVDEARVIFLDLLDLSEELQERGSVSRSWDMHRAGWMTCFGSCRYFYATFTRIATQYNPGQYSTIQ